MNFCFLPMFFNGFVFLFSETDFSFLESARPTHEVAVRFLFAFTLRIFQTEVNAENWLNVLSTRYLEKRCDYYVLWPTSLCWIKDAMV